MDQDACTAEERKMLTNDDHVFTISHANLKTFTGDQAHAQSGKILKSIGFETKFPPKVITLPSAHEQKRQIVIIAGAIIKNTYFTRDLITNVYGWSFPLSAKGIGTIGEKKTTCFVVKLPFKGQQVRPLAVARDLFAYSGPGAIIKTEQVYAHKLESIKPKLFTRKLEDLRKEEESLACQDTTKMPHSYLLEATKTKTQKLEKEFNRDEGLDMEVVWAKPLYHEMTQMCKADHFHASDDMKKIILKESGIAEIWVPSSSVFQVIDMSKVLRELKENVLAPYHSPVKVQSTRKFVAIKLKMFV